MSNYETFLLVIADYFISAVNDFNVERALELFSQEAVIDDPSTGLEFNGHEGIREYISRYFIGYNTKTARNSAECMSVNRIKVRVNFTGDFGQEIGVLIISVNDNGLISRIDANLE